MDSMRFRIAWAVVGTISVFILSILFVNVGFEGFTGIVLSILMVLAATFLYYYHLGDVEGQNR